MDARKFEVANSMVGDIKTNYLDDWDNRTDDEKLAGKALLKHFMDLLFAEGFTEGDLSKILLSNGIDREIEISKPDEFTLRRMQKINKISREFVNKYM